MSKVELHNEDCFDTISKLPNESVDLILTDIPYCVSMDNNFQTMKDRKGRNGIDFGEWDKTFDVRQLGLLTRVLKPNGSVVIFHSFEQYSDVRCAMENAGLVCKDKILWQKTNPMPRNRDRRYICDCEIASWYTFPKAKWTFNRQNDTYESMVMQYPSESGSAFKRYHPTQKNVKLMQKLVQIHSNEGGVVFDPFMGSGTTGVACVSTNRDFIGVEVDKKYFDTATKRIKESNNKLF